MRGLYGLISVFGKALQIGVSGAAGATYGGVVGGIFGAGIAVLTSPVTESFKRSIAEGSLEKLRITGRNDCDKIHEDPAETWASNDERQLP